MIDRVNDTHDRVGRGCPLTSASTVATELDGWAAAEGGSLG